MNRKFFPISRSFIGGFLTALVIVYGIVPSLRRSIPSDTKPQTVFVDRDSTPDETFFTPEELLFFTTGEGDPDKLMPRLPVFIRNQISSPSEKLVKSFTPGSVYDYSIHNVSIMVDKIMRGKRDGFYVECGAADGISQSNTAFFELIRNWTGLLIEGNLFMKPNLLKRGRNAYVLNTCLSTKTIPMFANFTNPEGFFMGGLTDHLTLSGVVTTPTCFPLTSVLDAIGRTHVDFFSLDIQGAELDVLKTIDFVKYRIDIIVVEYHVYPPKPDADQKRLQVYRKFFNETGLYNELRIPTAPNNAINVFDALFYRKDYVIGSAA